MKGQRLFPALCESGGAWRPKERSMRRAGQGGVVSIDSLVAEHRALDERVREMGRRAYLSPTEELEMQRLKKRKLAAKDLITDLRAKLAS
jgi:hypothetical protein